MQTQIDADRTLVLARRARDDYYLGMIQGNYDTCIKIEQDWGLYGYSPEVVTIGLNALAKGKDPYDTIDAYLVA